MKKIEKLEPTVKNHFSADISEIHFIKVAVNQLIEKQEELEQRQNEIIEHLDRINDVLIEHKLVGIK